MSPVAANTPPDARFSTKIARETNAEIR